MFLPRSVALVCEKSRSEPQPEAAGIGTNESGNVDGHDRREHPERDGDEELTHKIDTHPKDPGQEEPSDPTTGGKKKKNGSGGKQGIPRRLGFRETAHRRSTGKKPDKREGDRNPRATRQGKGRVPIAISHHPVNCLEWHGHHPRTTL